MSQPFKLYRLQQIDSQLDWMQARIKEIEMLLNESEALRQARQHAAEINQAHQETHKKLLAAEDNVRQQRVKIEQSESTLYGGKVHNPKELQDLQNEVASLKRYLGVLEDKQLEAMFAEEEARSANEIAAAELEKAIQQHKKQSNEMIEERGKLQRDIARFQGERQASVAGIPEADISQYEQLRQKRRGIAVSKVTDRTCSACGAMLSAALLDAAHSPNQLTRCETCGRILYIG